VNCCSPRFVGHDPVPGGVDTSPNPVVLRTQPQPGETLRADFGVARRDSTSADVLVEGLVYRDLNGDGHPDPGEPGIPGVLLVGSTNCPTFAPIEARTNERGLYSMRLPGGECGPPWIVHEVTLPGTTTPNPVIFDAPPPPGTPFRADFGVAPGGQVDSLAVEGVVFKDENANGVRDAGEGGIADVGVSASGLPCLTPGLAHTRTDPRGHYLLLGKEVHCRLPWVVGQEGIPGTRNTSPNPAILQGPPPADGIFHVDFGVASQDSTPPPHGFTIEGSVFLDLNANGLRDGGEPGVSGAEVQLQSLCTVFRATHTDLEGRYRFDPHVVGACPVSAAWQSAPVFPQYTTPNPAPVDSVPPPGSVLRIDFGVRRAVPPR